MTRDPYSAQFAIQVAPVGADVAHCRHCGDGITDRLRIRIGEDAICSQCVHANVSIELAHVVDATVALRHVLNDLSRADESLAVCTIRAVHLALEPNTSALDAWFGLDEA